MKKLEDYSDSEKFYMLLHGTLGVVKYVNKERIKYNLYKEDSSITFKNYNLENFQILELLEKLGYPMDEAGTYLYKDLILNIISKLKGANSSYNAEFYKSLLEQVQDGFSQIYFEESRYSLNLGVKPYHKILENSINKIDYSKADTLLLFKIYSNIGENLNYGVNALILASYFLGYKNNISFKAPKIKKLVNSSGEILKDNI